MFVRCGTAAPAVGCALAPVLRLLLVPGWAGRTMAAFGLLAGASPRLPSSGARTGLSAACGLGAGAGRGRGCGCWAGPPFFHHGRASCLAVGCVAASEPEAGERAWGLCVKSS